MFRIMAISRVWNWLGCQFRSLILRSLGATTDRQIISLADLPPEIVSHVVSFLPAPSAAALALCDHKINSALGTKYWQALGSWREGGGRKYTEIPCIGSAMAEEPLENNRSDFLMLLERDLPDYIFCRRCALLHLPIPERGSTHTRFCNVADLITLSFKGLAPDTRFYRLQWIMKRHRMNVNCSKELDHLFYERYCYQRYWDGQDCGRYNINETRIRNGKVLVRDQDWFLVPAKFTGSPNFTSPLTDFFLTAICSHSWYRMEGSLLTHVIDCKLSRWSSKISCLACDRLQQCHGCYTEFQVDVKHFGKQELALVITTWVDLGECQTPMDPKWRLRIFNSMIGEREVAVFKPGSIQESFEDGRAFLFDSILTPKREKQLLRTGFW